MCSATSDPIDDLKATRRALQYAASKSKGTWFMKGQGEPSMAQPLSVHATVELGMWEDAK